MREEHRGYRERLLFETPPGDFAKVSGDTRQAMAEEYAAASPERQAVIADLVADLTIDLGSYLTRWHLLAPRDGVSLDRAVVRREVEHNRDLLRRWGADGRLAVVDAEIAAIERSNLRRLSELADDGELDSRWGHDAATGLTWAVRRGAVLVTTNPVMVNSVRKEDPATWDAVRDALRATHPDATPEQRVSLMTMNVVLEECRELRPIWKATGGRYGYVSLQVNPRASEDAGRMAEEVDGSPRAAHD